MPGKGRGRRKKGEAAKIATLLLFILIGLGVIAGSIWYNGFFQPRSEEQIKEVALGFTKEFFSVGFQNITGLEGRNYMTEELAQRILTGERASSWQERELTIEIKGDVEVSTVQKRLRDAVVRVVFWQQEKTKDEEGKAYLIYYDLDLALTGGRWLVDKIQVAEPAELQALRQREGVIEELPAETQ